MQQVQHSDGCRDVSCCVVCISSAYAWYLLSAQHCRLRPVLSWLCSKGTRIKTLVLETIRIPRAVVHMHQPCKRLPLASTSVGQTHQLQPIRIVEAHATACDAYARNQNLVVLAVHQTCSCTGHVPNVMAPTLWLEQLGLHACASFTAISLHRRW